MRLSVADLKILEEAEGWLNDAVNEEFSMTALFSDLVQRLKADSEVKKMTPLQDWVFNQVYYVIEAKDAALADGFCLALEEFGGEVPFAVKVWESPASETPERIAEEQVEVPVPKALSR